MRALVLIVAGLTAGACSSGGNGPVEQDGLWHADGLVIERRGENLLLIRADDGTAVKLEVKGNARVQVEAQALPSIQALFEGDRVRASWTGQINGGEAQQVIVTRPDVDILNVSEARLARAERAEPYWLDTFESPGSTMTAPWYVGVWRYRPPEQRVGPPHVNPITDELVPSDARPGL